MERLTSRNLLAANAFSRFHWFADIRMITEKVEWRQTFPMERTERQRKHLCIHLFTVRSIHMYSFCIFLWAHKTVYAPTDALAANPFHLAATSSERWPLKGKRKQLPKFGKEAPQKGNGARDRAAERETDGEWMGKTARKTRKAIASTASMTLREEHLPYTIFSFSKAIRLRATITLPGCWMRNGNARSISFKLETSKPFNCAKWLLLQNH